MKQQIFVTALPNGLVSTPSGDSSSSSSPELGTKATPTSTTPSKSLTRNLSISKNPAGFRPATTANPDFTLTAGSVRCKVSAAFGLQVEQIGSELTLSSVPDMLHWAERIQSAQYKVLIDGHEVPCKITSAAVDTELWQHLFRPTVKVKAFEQENLSTLPIASYPVKHIVDHIQSIMSSIGSQFSSDLPGTDAIIQNPAFSAISDYQIITTLPDKPRETVTVEDVVRAQTSGNRVKAKLKKTGAIPFETNSAVDENFAQLKNFHGLYDHVKGRNFTQVDPPDFEFHDILSALTAYPQLLRQLGLVVDLEFDMPKMSLQKTSDPFASTVRIIPFGVDFTQNATFVCPATRYKRTQSGFYAKPQFPDVQDLGHMKINGPEFTVFQIDTDGGALKLCQQSDALILKTARQSVFAANSKIKNPEMMPLFNNEAPRKEAPTSHRTAGIAVARNGAAEALRQRFVKMNGLRPGLLTSTDTPSGLSGNHLSWTISEKVLEAEDLTLGFRMDVQSEDHPGRWFSLYRRNNHYSYLDPSGQSVEIPDLGEDEGYTQTSASEEESDQGKRLKVGEVLTRWEGWSLSVPRPGSALNDPKLDDEQMYDKRQSGSPLKEAEKYKTPANADFRLNVIATGVKGSLPRLRFGKKYAIRLRTVDLAGNSVPLESDPEDLHHSVVKDIRYLRYEPVDAPFLVLGTPLRDGESAEHMVIRSNEGISVKQYEHDHVASHQAEPHSDESIRHVKPPRTTVESATTHGMLDAAFGPEASAQAIKIYQKITADKDPLVEEDQATHVMKVEANKTTLPVEYLADPLATGVCFYISAEDPNPKLPDPEILTRRVSFYFDEEVNAEAYANQKVSYAKWMEPKTFRIVLKEGAPAVRWLPKPRVLEITLQKGAMVKINYACFWRPDDLKKLSGTLEMMGANLLNSAVGKRILTGQHWAFSPWRTLTLVHATQQPLTEVGGQKYPVIKQLTPTRDFNAGFALLNSQLLVHGPSTGQVDLEASWTEWEDDVTKPAAETHPEFSKVFHFHAPYLVFDYRFGNTAPNNPFPAIKHEFGDTKHRIVDYTMIASTRYREYFYQLIADAAKAKKTFPLIRESEVVKSVIIPSSARPLAPEIEYVIPTFEWERVANGKKTTSGRISGLRVYLRRPWYSSGQGEQLAVILALQINDMLSSRGALVTTWGNDPTKDAHPLPGKGVEPEIENIFASANLQSDIGLTTAETSGPRVAVAAYDVKYDAERQLYYVDIMFKLVASYYPFVRLALARYQRQSVRTEKQDCCLSPIVQADYIQIPPPRGASIEFGAANNIVTVAISGNQPRTGNSYFFRRAVEFVVEPIDIDRSQSIHITLPERTIDTYQHQFTSQETAQTAFAHNHTFTLPQAYATQSYRIKVAEYEQILYDPKKPNPNPGGQHYGTRPLKERLVYADVFEVNT